MRAGRTLAVPEFNEVRKVVAARCGPVEHDRREIDDRHARARRAEPELKHRIRRRRGRTASGTAEVEPDTIDGIPAHQQRPHSRVLAHSIRQRGFSAVIAAFDLKAQGSRR